MVSPLFMELGSPFGGLKVRTNSRMEIAVEDWSEVRSPGRARRRRAKHRQRIRIRYIPDPKIIRIGDGLVMHPETYRRLQEQHQNIKEGIYDDPA